MQFDFDAGSLDVEVPSVDQVGMVVEDLDDGMARFDALLGVGPWHVHRFEPPALSAATYRGESGEYTFRAALATVGEVDLELIEPLAGENTYTEHLDEHGEGLHHVAPFGFEDPPAAVAAFEEANVPVVQSGTYRGGQFWYLDTREHLNGVLFEVVERAGEGPPEPRRTYPE